MSLHNVPFGDIKAFHVVVEISQGSQDKYEYDEKLDVMKLDRVLYGSQRFPANYGFVPETRAADGDHTDVVLLSTNPIIPGAVVTARAIGFMEMIDSGEVDNKIIAVSVDDPRFNDILSLADLPDHTTKEIQNFFETYKLLQKKTVTINGFGDVARAEQELLTTREAYKAE
jgi:inorganic pyrophosphatase